MKRNSRKTRLVKQAKHRARVSNAARRHAARGAYLRGRIEAHEARVILALANEIES